MLAKMSSMAVIGIDAFNIEIEADTARKEKKTGMIVPTDCAQEASVAEGLDIYPVSHLFLS